jgi:hypothetical protein
MLQNVLFDELQHRSARLIERAESIPDRFPPEALRRRPAPGSWSPAEVLEHLCRADAGYLERMRALVRDARADDAGGGRPDHRWRPTLMGRLLVWALTAKRPVKTTAQLQPRDGGTRGEEALRAFLELRRESDRLLAQSRTLPWRRLRFTSPYLAVLRPNLGEGFLILVVHAERHMDQIDRCGAPARIIGAPA